MLREETEKELRARLRANPRNLAPRRQLAELLVSRGDRRAAATEYLAISESFVENDMFFKAVRVLDQVSRLAPDRADLELRKAKLEGLEATLSRRDSQIARLARRSVRSIGPASLTAFDLRRFWVEIGTSPFVTELDDDALGLLFATAEVQQWTPMTIVVREGQWLPRCYLITYGVFEAGIDAKRRTLRRFLPGEVIGERTLFDEIHWPASYRVEGSATALRLTAQRFRERVSGEKASEALIEGFRRHGGDRVIETLLGP